MKYEQLEFDFDGVNWVVYKDQSARRDNYIVGYRGYSFIELIEPIVSYPVELYCPYIPLIFSQSLQP